MEVFWTAGTFVQYLSFSASTCVIAQKARVGSCFATISTEVETPIRPYFCWFGYFFVVFFLLFLLCTWKKRFVPSLLSHFKSVGNCDTFHPSQAGRAYGEDFPAYSPGTSPCFIISYLPWAACCLALVHPARISGTGCSVPTSRMSQGGVAVMGSQISVERERVHFSLHAPSLCSSSQTWHGEECCF